MGGKSVFQLIPFTREAGWFVWNMKLLDTQTERKAEFLQELLKIMIFFFHFKKNAHFFCLYACGTWGNRNAPQCLSFQKEGFGHVKQNFFHHIEQEGSWENVIFCRIISVWWMFTEYLLLFAFSNMICASLLAPQSNSLEVIFTISIGNKQQFHVYS